MDPESPYAQTIASDLETMNSALKLDPEAVAAFCRKWRIRELSVFGSAVRDDFGPESDVDFMASFEPGVSLDIDNWLDMKEELGVLCGRSAGLVEKEALRNPWIKHGIMKTREVVYGV